MKAVVFHDIGDIRLEDVAEPRLREPTDAIVRLTASAICGTDLHFVRGSVGGMRPGTILGHEGVGIVEALGDEVRNLQVGDRVVIPSTIACGNCVYCRAGYYAQCDVANPGGAQAGTAFFGGPQANGGFHGLQAEKARIPFANIGLIRLPSAISDDQAILLSDIFPTGYFGAELAEITPGDTVAVFGCGPVGQFAIASALLMGAARVFAVDRHPDGAATAAPRQDGTSWSPGNAPAQALEWAVQGLAKAGTLSIIGVYAEDSRQFPIGLAMNRNLTIRMGNCHHRKYIPRLLDYVLSGRIDPARILTQVKPIGDAIEAFEAFDRRETGWIKVELTPQKQRVEGDEERVDESVVDELARRPTPESGARG
ncbi:glutathione-dependent formaldehyde dehydrogenase [Pseudomonas aeruginosa]|nr:glutathione-dependent formaldehyde dehydrogenase [Pseudomonas aeruginosa]